MSFMDCTIKICGEAGQGLQTIGAVLSLVFARAGHHVFTHQDYESRIRGGHNFYQIRISHERIMSSKEDLDIVISLNRTGIELHRPELKKEGIIAFDAETLKQQPENPSMMDVPFRMLAEQEGGSPVMSNTVATGAVLGILGKDAYMPILEDLLRNRFKKKGDPVVDGNIKSARAGYEYAKQNCKECRFLPVATSDSPKILLNGQEAAAVGALSSGCKFYSAYPMTPSTGIMNHIASRAARHGVIVEQAEDEIAAINMALGASFAGVRAATGSSGGGFALMVEGLSLCGMTETPVVIFEAQRPGPATGLPTRTEQADLLFVLFAGHGEFPRVVFAPGSPEQLIFLTNKAFDLAEKYQIPAFVMFDQYLSDSQWTYDEIDTTSLLYNDYRSRGESPGENEQYKRHAFTDSGVSPLAVPGDSRRLVVTDSDEHDEEGHIIEDGLTRNRMVDKRIFKKINSIKAELSPPIRYGEENPDMLLAGWGSTYGVLKETVDALNASGKKTAMLFFNEIYPLPDGDYIRELELAESTVCVEGHATGQFAGFFRMQTGFKFHDIITRYDGRPFTVEYILRELQLAKH
jgi:2-oxoglutarate ferredoxin oxidoreductase subunit alpha